MANCTLTCWASLGCSVQCSSNWGCSFGPRQIQQHSFVEIVHEIFNAVILSCPLMARRAVVNFVGEVGWSSGAKVYILHHQGVQLILASSWARPAIIIAGKGRGGMFLFLLFLHFRSCSSSLFLALSSLLLSLFSLSLWNDTKWLTRVDMLLNPSTINQSIKYLPALRPTVYAKDEENWVWVQCIYICLCVIWSWTHAQKGRWKSIHEGWVGG